MAKSNNPVKVSLRKGAQPKRLQSRLLVQKSEPQQRRATTTTTSARILLQQQPNASSIDDLINKMGGARVDLPGGEGDMNLVTSALANTTLKDSVVTTKVPLNILFADFFNAEGIGLVNAALLDNESDVKSISNMVANKIVKRYISEDPRFAPLPPKTHPLYPNWVAGYRSSNILTQWVHNKHCLDQIPTRDELPAIYGSASNLNFIKYKNARGHALATRPLPTTTEDLRALSEWISDSILLMKCAQREGHPVAANYIPPFGPKRHPSYPFWVLGHPANRFIRSEFANSDVEIIGYPRPECDLIPVGVLRSFS